MKRHKQRQKSKYKNQKTTRTREREREQEKRREDKRREEKRIQEQTSPLKKESPFTWDQGDRPPDPRYTGLGQGGHNKIKKTNKQTNKQTMIYDI